jgi:thiol-disulfide isomerase/thioredoxin
MKLFLLCIPLLMSLHFVQAQTPEPAPALLSVGAQGIDALRAKYKGSVLVLNFWATWCTPCKEEFPAFIKLHKSYAGKGLAVVFVSIDDDDPKTKKQALAFLRKQQAPFPSYIKASGDDEQFINAVHPKWSGAVPATFVYDRRGVLVTMKFEETNFTELNELLKPLLR